MMKKFLLLSISLFCATSLIKAQNNVVIDGITINLDEIPLNRELKIPISNNTKSLSEGKTLQSQKVFASDNKQFVAIASSYENAPSTKGTAKVGELKIYNKSGSLHWQAKQEYKHVVNCKIADNATIVHTIWYEESDIPDLYELKSYDNTGNNIFTYNTSAVYLSNDMQRMCFISEIDYSNYKIVYKDFQSGLSWEKTLSGNIIGLIDISAIGNKVLVGSDKLYCLDDVGNIIWENPTYFNCKLSDDGSKVININRSKQVQIFDIENNRLLFERDNYLNINSEFKPTKCSFVENANEYYALASTIGFLKTLVVVFDSSNNIYKQFIISDTRLLTELRLIDSGSNVNVYFDGVKVYSY